MTKFTTCAISAGVAAVVGATTPSSAPPPAELVLRDVRESSGITFVHHSAPEKRYIVESMSGGVAAFDYDNDGRLDLYFVDSLTVDTAGDPKKARSALYRNLGGMRFEDVTDRAGVGHPGWGMGVCVADVDDDGWRDLYVTGLGRNVLYRNRGDGTFEDATQRLGLAASGWSTGCTFADPDRDGNLDLFVARYVAIDLAKLPEFGRDRTCQYRGVAVQCGPRGLPGEGDFYFRNDGGRFVEVAAAVGVADPEAYYGLGAVFFDADQDGWLDLLVANDSTPNFLYRNTGKGTFEESAFPLGLAVSDDGAEQGSMGIALGDDRNQGRLSVYVTNFAEEYNTLLRQADGYFQDASFTSGTAAPSLPYVGWGTAFVDLDNNGWQDLVVVNGHVYPQLDSARLGASAPYRQRRLVYRNQGDGRYQEVGEQLGEAFSKPRVSRGLAVGDLDGDGRIDLVINDLDGPPQILHNQTATNGHWLTVELVGPPGNRDAIGASIEVRSGTTKRLRVVQSGTSYLSHNDFRQHVGLGDTAKVDEITVRWPDGTSTTEKTVAVDRVVTIRHPKAER